MMSTEPDVVVVRWDPKAEPYHFKQYDALALPQDELDALQAIHDTLGGCGNPHGSVSGYRSCAMQKIPQLKKRLLKAEAAALQQGRGVQKLRKKLDILMHGTPKTEAPPAAILAP